MKKLLVSIIFGFTLGVTLLILSYLGIYYVAGQETFNLVILKLVDINVLQNQILGAGFAGTMLAFVVYIMESFIENDKQSPYFVIFSMVASLLALIISMYHIKNMKSFDEVTSSMLLIFSVVLICAYMLFRCTQEAIDEFILNKKLKEKNR